MFDPIDCPSIGSYSKSDFKRDFEEAIKPYEKQINDMTVILHDNCQRIKFLEKNISKTTFILELNEYDYEGSDYDNTELKEALSRFNAKEINMPGCLYDRNGYNQYYIQLQTLDDLALLQQKLGSRLFIDFSQTTPRIATEEEV